jgi:hypothetical protein
MVPRDPLGSATGIFVAPGLTMNHGMPFGVPSATEAILGQRASDRSVSKLAAIGSTCETLEVKSPLRAIKTVSCEQQKM